MVGLLHNKNTWTIPSQEILTRLTNRSRTWKAHSGWFGVILWIGPILFILTGRALDGLSDATGEKE